MNMLQKIKKRLLRKINKSDIPEKYPSGNKIPYELRLKIYREKEKIKEEK